MKTTVLYERYVSSNEGYEKSGMEGFPGLVSLKPSMEMGRFTDYKRYYFRVSFRK